jgi:hypothetical protein
MCNKSKQLEQCAGAITSLPSEMHYGENDYGNRILNQAMGNFLSLYLGSLNVHKAKSL